MRILFGMLGITLALGGCIRASIVEADGPQVTYCLEQGGHQPRPGLQPRDQLLRRLERAAEADRRPDRRPAAHLDLQVRAPPHPAVREHGPGPAAEQDLAMADPTNLSAREAVRQLRAKEVSPLELIDAALARIAAVDPAVNAVPTLCVERARDHARRIMAGSAEAGLLAGPAGADQGPGRGRGRAHDLRLADLPRPRAGILRLAGRAHRGRGRRRAGQDQHAGIRCRGQHLQRGVRHHPQPVEPGPHLRRLLGRGGGGAGDRHGLARRRLRPRRLPAHAGLVLRRGRACAPRPAGCPTGRAACPSVPSASRGRWPATCAMPPCSWTCWRASTRAIP